MKRSVSLLVCLLWQASSPLQAAPLPYAEVGLSPRQAAVHLLQRLTFGVEPGELARMEAEGLEPWVERQLAADQAEPELAEKLQGVGCLAMEEVEVRTAFLPRNRLVELAEKEGLERFTEGDPTSRRRYEMSLTEFQRQQGLLSVNDLFDQLRFQKLVRTCSARNQLREVLTDFWFNHFNVSALEQNVRYNALSYEQALRQQALGSFPEMLVGVARHPAMLHYLNNTQSSARPGVRTTLNVCFEAASRQRQPDLRPGQPLQRKNGGLNENFAREVLELHTLGVDGGYSQQDVVEVARALSGWTVFYRESENTRLKELIEPGLELGYQRQGDFLFRADWHDAESKTILGRTFEAGGGLEEGEEVLRFLAAQPATARFVCRKLAQRFVSDEPPEALVESMAQAFRLHGGEIRPTLRAMLEHRAFWEAATQPRKFKSPLEYFASCLRLSGAQLSYEPGVFYWFVRMGQPLYACAPPTGYPEDSRHWITSSPLLQRLTFASQLAEGRIRGLQVDWQRFYALEGDLVEPLGAFFLPERSWDRKPLDGQKLVRPGDGYPPQRAWFRPTRPADLEVRQRQILCQRVIGVLLGSPEFQYR